MVNHSLSFTLRPARTPADLALACHLRAEGYGHRLASIKQTMAHPDAVDHAPGTTTFLCEDKLSGRPVGTMRVQTTTRGGGLLEIEKSVPLTSSMAQDGRAEMSRLVVLAGSDPLVKLALWKAGYLFCYAAQVRWLMMGARKPGLIRQYERLGCRDLFDDGRFVPLHHGGNLPHRVLVFDVVAAERTWYACNHPLYKFMVETFHHDIDVGLVKRYAPTRIDPIAA